MRLAERAATTQTEKVNTVQELPPHGLVSVSKLCLNLVTSSESLKTSSVQWELELCLLLLLSQLLTECFLLIQQLFVGGFFYA